MDGATVKDSKISNTNTNVNNTATGGSTVNSGIDLGGN